MAGELGMRRFKPSAVFIVIRVIAGHGLPTD
jgi:hypothetical protein